MVSSTKTDTFEEAAERYKALADKTRLRILAILSYGERCVCELVAMLSMSQPSISQHLRKLRQAGFIKERKTAQWVYYTLSEEHIPLLKAILAELSEGIATFAPNESNQAICCLENEVQGT
jgi:ArsR family transcriptional regulator